MRPAFALFELVVVLGLLAFLACLTIPTFKIFDELAVSMELDNLCALILSLQQRACMDGRAYILKFDPQGQKYVVREDLPDPKQRDDGGGGWHALPREVQFGILPGLKGPPAQPDRQLEWPSTFKGDSITFHPATGVIESGSLYLIDRARCFQYALTVPVGKFSYVRRYVYKEKWTLLA